MDDSTIKMPILRPLPIETKKLNPISRMGKWAVSTRRWEVVEDFYYTYKGFELVIPKGFIFDGASIPRIFWTFLHPTGLLLIPSMFHDFAYAHDFLWQRLHGFRIKYKEGAGKGFWDLLFMHLGQQINGVHFVNLIAWSALTLGGWLAWLSKRKAPPYETDIKKRGVELDED
jgi:hypothetical protein